jgi:hypothetical protein
MGETKAPWAAKALKLRAEYSMAKGFLVDGKKLFRKKRYGVWCYEFDTRGCRYQIPMHCFAWYFHVGEWPARAVRVIDKDILNLEPENLRLSTNHPTPQVRLVGRIKHG